MVGKIKIRIQLLIYTGFLLTNLFVTSFASANIGTIEVVTSSQNEVLKGKELKEKKTRPVRVINA